MQGMFCQYKYHGVTLLTTEDLHNKSKNRLFN